jgi:spore coat protein U-like protein
MKRVLRKHLLALAALASFSGFSQAAIVCGTVTASSVTGNTPLTGNLDLVGQFVVTCTRLTTDPTTRTIYIGINLGENPDGTAGREMTRQSGAQQMNYGIFRNPGFTGGWSEGTARNPGATQGGGLNYGVVFSSAATVSQNFTIPYYFRVTNGNYAPAPAGIYDDLGVLVRVRASQNGTIESSTTFGPTVSKPSHCYFSLPPSTLNIAYTSFATSASTGSVNFGVSCTNTTSYNMSLSATGGTLLGLNYTLALSATGAQVGTGFQQNYSVNGSIAAGQSGTCAASTCNATQARTLTITY